MRKHITLAIEEVRRFAVRRFLEGTVSDGRSLAGTVFSVALIAAFTLLGATLNPATAMAASSRDGAAKKSLFIAVPYPSTSALINDLNHICNEHKGDQWAPQDPSRHPGSVLPGRFDAVLR